jgi:Skp family chaperone for outer membrane proteins
MRPGWMMSIAVVLASAPIATAQQAAPGAARSPRVAVMEMERLSRESNIGKDYAARIAQVQKDVEQRRAQTQAALAQMQERITKLQRELAATGATLSADEQQERRYEITKATREREAAVEDGRLALGRLQQEAAKKSEALNNELRSKIRPFIRAVIQERGLDLVIDRRFCSYVAEAYDATADVVAKINAAEAVKPAAPAAK